MRRFFELEAATRAGPSKKYRLIRGVYLLLLSESGNLDKGRNAGNAETTVGGVGYG
jgi:hypothetical protein